MLVLEKKEDFFSLFCFVARDGRRVWLQQRKVAVGEEKRGEEDFVSLSFVFVSLLFCFCLSLFLLRKTDGEFGCSKGSLQVERRAVGMNEGKERRPEMAERGEGRRRKKVCVVVMAGVVLVTVVLVTLGLTLFRARDPEVQMRSIHLETFSIQADSLSMSLLLGMTVLNPNREQLRYYDCLTRLFYYGDPVGHARLPAGNIKAKESHNLEMVLVVEAGDRVLGSANLPGNIVRGLLPVMATTTMAGIVRVLGVFKHHAVSTVHCNISIFVANATLHSFVCKHGMRI